MSFSGSVLRHSLKQKQYKSSSLFQHTKRFPKTATKGIRVFLKKAASCTFREAGGSLTVEASLVLPLFLFLCLGLVFLHQVFEIHSEVQGGLFLAARDISQNALLLGAEEELSGKDAAEKALGITLGRKKVLEYAAKELDSYNCLVGGSGGLQFLYSSITDDTVDLVVTYEVRLPYALGVDVTFPIVQRCRMHLWNGMEGSGEDDAEEEMVYITETGTVYHKSADCTHIKLSIRQVPSSVLTVIRNLEGAKYKPCEKCVKSGVKESWVYITNEGNRYHNSVGCSGLKRTVKQIPISEVGSRGPCSKCAK